MKTVISWFSLLLMSVVALWGLNEIAYAGGARAVSTPLPVEHVMLASAPANLDAPEPWPLPPPRMGTSTSPVMPAPDPGDDASGFMAWSFNAIRSKNGWLIASCLVVAASFLLRLGARRHAGFLAWFATDRGGVALTAIVATLGGFAHATAAGHAPGWSFVIEVIDVWLGAIGIYVAAKRAIAPKDVPPLRMPDLGPDVPQARVVRGGGAA